MTPPAVERAANCSWFRLVMACTGLLAACWLVYWPVVTHGFVNFDDNDYVYENHHVRQGLTSGSVSWAIGTGFLSNWHPITWLSLMFDAECYGDWAGGFHLTNLLLRCGSVTLLFLALHRLTGVAGPSFIVAALYAVHPLHAESVAWVSERKGMLSTLFWMLSLWAYARCQEQPSRGRWAVVGVCMALGMMSKQMLITLPAALTLLDVWPLQRPLQLRLLREKWPLFLLAVGCSVAAYQVQERGGSVSPIPLVERLKFIPVAYVTYLRDAVWPAALYNPYLRATAGFGWDVTSSCAAAILMVTGILWCRRERQPYLLMGWFWYLGAAFPVVGLIPLGVTWRADRYTDIPMIGIYVAIVWSGFEIWRRWQGVWRWSLVGGITLVLLLLGARAPAILCLAQQLHAVDAHPQARSAEPPGSAESGRPPAGARPV